MSQTAVMETGLASNGSMPETPAGASPDDAGHNSKSRQIFDGAREVFLSSGFDGASMNDVARAAGVSKGTLYVYFDSKERLFEALIRFDRARQAEQLCQFDPHDHDVRAVLRRFGTELLDMMTRPAHIAHLRTVVAVAAKFPQIGRAFFEAGPAVAIARLSAYLAAQVESGQLAIADPVIAAQQFLELCKAGTYMRVLFGVSGQPTLPDIIASVDRGLDAFLKIYAAPQQGGGAAARA